MISRAESPGSAFRAPSKGAHRAERALSARVYEDGCAGLERALAEV